MNTKDRKQALEDTFGTISEAIHNFYTYWGYLGSHKPQEEAKEPKLPSNYHQEDLDKFDIQNQFNALESELLNKIESQQRQINGLISHTRNLKERLEVVEVHADVEENHRETVKRNHDDLISSILERLEAVEKKLEYIAPKPPSFIANHLSKDSSQPIPPTPTSVAQTVQEKPKGDNNIFKLCGCVYEYTDKQVKSEAVFRCQWTHLTGDLYAFNNCTKCNGIGYFRKLAD